jgi:hypothetical protein
MTTGHIKATAISNAKTFQAGRLKHHYKAWTELTSDPHILKIVTGADIEFDQIPIQHSKPSPYKFSQTKSRQITQEVEVMLRKQVIEIVKKSDVAFVSNIFTRVKADGSLRVILDLTLLNESVTYRHFKMDSLLTAINLMSQDCYMASIDLKDAYYSVPVSMAMRKYLAFQWEGTTYRYTCLPNGLACAPRYFTKITKVLFAQLREKGHMSTSYIDDCLLVAKSPSSCAQNVLDTAQLSVKAGFVVHPIKSVLQPTQGITYLGFWLNSVSMTVKLTDVKALKLKSDCQNLLTKKNITIRDLSRVTGSMVASFPGVQYAQLFYRSSDNLKNEKMKSSYGNLDATITLSQTVKQDLKWWIGHIETAEKRILLKPYSLVIETDASNTGWGACIENKPGNSTGGLWSKSETSQHINCKELLAAWFGLRSYANKLANSHIKILSDNTTTVAYINNQGGTKIKCNDIARKIWEWCYQNNIWLTACHLPGSKNVTADRESRSTHDNMEWELDSLAYREICTQFGDPKIDLFASRLNNKVKNYISFKPDPHATAVNAMSESWGDTYFYAFPPFNMVGRVLQKAEQENCCGIVVVPRWTTQAWWPKFTQLCSDIHVISREKGRPLLTHPRRQESELPRMTLVAGRIYNNSTE